MRCITSHSLLLALLTSFLQDQLLHLQRFRLGFALADKLFCLVHFLFGCVLYCIMKTTEVYQW